MASNSKASQGALRRWALGALSLAFVVLALLAPLPWPQSAPQVRHIDITARSFEFDPGIVQVNRGDTVLIKLQAEDAVHGLFVDGYAVSAQAEPGQPAELRFVADRPGAFRMRCAVPCGNLHPFMIGKLLVGPNLTWLRAALATLLTTIGALAVFWKS